MMQSSDVLVRPMLGVALFQGLSLEQIALIARNAERIVYRSGDTIIAANTEGDAAVLIVSGDAVRISGLGLEDEVEAVAEGSLLGEMAMLVEMEYGSTVIARGQVRALRITREGLKTQMERDPVLVDHFLHMIAGRLSELASELRAVDRALTGTVEETTMQQAQLH